jgi:transposase
MTSDLLALSDWLMSCGVTPAAMESTGEHWKPIFNILENNFEVILVNAQHISKVPGRKTDVSDAEWIADLLRHGLLTASFIPPLGQRELRELTRFRSTFVKERHAGQSGTESFGKRQYQVVQCSLGCSWRIGTGNAGSHHCWDSHT